MPGPDDYPNPKEAQPPGGEIFPIPQSELDQAQPWPGADLSTGGEVDERLDKVISDLHYEDSGTGFAWPNPEAITSSLGLPVENLGNLATGGAATYAHPLKPEVKLDGAVLKAVDQRLEGWRAQQRKQIHSQAGDQADPNISQS